MGADLVHHFCSQLIVASATLSPFCMSLDDLLKSAPIEVREARILAAHSLQWSRVQLITQSKQTLSAKQVDDIQHLFQRRLQGEPIAYVVGQREFYGLLFEVTPAVLIPRPETELLVELAIQRMPRNACVLDMGTGSGAIAVSLAHTRPDSQIFATDISQQALAVAERNSMLHHTPITFFQSNWYEQVNGKFDLIVSNPPYICADDIHLSQGDLRFEPVDALTDHSTGFTAIEKIIHGAPAYLEHSGWLLLEHGYDQASEVRNLFLASTWSDVQSWRDLAGIERVTGARLL
jgi:release factor glutamine methyltransferase